MAVLSFTMGATNRCWRIVTVSDITQRKRVEERLREQADIINHARDAIIIRHFQDDRITFWNKGAEHLYGWTANEALGKPAGNCSTPMQRA